jgi:hypothetical protein
MKISRLLVLCFSLVSGTALANPVEYVVRLSVEATGNTHVLVRFISNKSSPPEDLTTFGTSHSDWWPGAGTSENTGSGLERLDLNYMCDCHVPTGSPLTYTSARLGQYSPKMTATLTPIPGSGTTICDERCALADQADAGQASSGGTGGSASSGASSAASSGAAGNSGAAAGGNPSVESARAAYNDAHSSACSFSSHGRDGAISLLLVLGLVALSSRRRR